MERGLPTGTVTFLFTDIEGSTRLLDELGTERYADALDEHRRLVRAACEEHGGVEVDTQGDAFFFAFQTAPDALAAAADTQRALAAGPIRVRIGVHTGTPHVGAEGYVGTDVHRAARIAAVAHGGQVVISSATAELVDPATLSDLGEHRLKDLTRPQHLHQLDADGLGTEFPPLRSLDRMPTNLPVQAARLIGRERELKETRELLGDVRLLTLTGPGGTGKTRLAIQLAADVVDEFEDGVFFVDLAEIDDPGLVVPAVAGTLGLSESGGRDLHAVVTGYLAGKRVLLLLDNVERVVEVAPAVSEWLSAAPGVKVLATSRIPFRLAGEQEFPVSPLGERAAVELFADRARAVRPDFSVERDPDVVAQICIRLDALPLAIELAAARVKLLPPAKLLERLDERLPVLTGGARDAPERHRTLRAAIDWSFTLLGPDEQELFARLSVFAGGFTLEAAEEVCDATIDDLASLLEKSLLAQRDGFMGDARFSMLETVREYARAQLDRRDEAALLSERHARYFLALAERAAVRGSDADPQWGRALAFEVDNLRRARDWFRESDDVEGGLRLATAAQWGLWTRWSLRELKDWGSDALGRAPGVDGYLRADALGAFALIAANLNDYELAREAARESLALARESGDKRQIEWALRVLTFDEPDLEERRRLLDECERLLRELGNEVGLGWVTYLRGMTLLDEGKPDEAYQALAHAESILSGLGRAEEAVNSQNAAALALIRAGRTKPARTLLERSLRVACDLDATSSMMEALAAYAGLVVEDDPRLAARLLGVVEHAASTLLPLDRYYGPLADDASRAARERLGDLYEHERDAGRSLSLDEAVELALR